MRLTVAALALACVAAAAIVRRGRCDTCGSYVCLVNVAGLERRSDRTADPNGGERNATST